MRDPLHLICTCEATMPLDGAALAAAGATGKPFTQLCRAHLAHFRDALARAGADDRDVLVGCTQEAPLFRDLAEAEDFGGQLAFVNLRETAGWSDEAKLAGPKMAALLAMGAIPDPGSPTRTLDSGGVALVLGRDTTALAVAQDLERVLDITVLLTPGAEVVPPRETRFPVLQGRARTASGALGGFKVTVDALAAPDPSSRARLDFGPAQDGAGSACGLILDLTGGPALFPAPDLRRGYLRADPRDPVAVARLTVRAAGLVGSVDAPVHIDLRSDLCAHARNGLTGCTRCLSLCPTGAITPAGDSVAIDPDICAGCGACAAACPTGAAGHTLPGPETLVARLRAGLAAWHDSGDLARRLGAPTILIHDTDHGAGLIDAAARFGRGLPARVIPVAVNAVTQAGPELLAAALAYGAGAIRIVTPARPMHDLTGLDETLALMDLLTAAAGWPEGTLGLIQTDDPTAFADTLHALPARPARAILAAFPPPGDKRALLVTAVAEMNRTAPAPVAALPLPDGAPFGTVVLNPDACTLCLACVGACPTGALQGDAGRPTLRFTETACVQCGLCVATCPESAITLAPRLDTGAWDNPRRILHARPPAAG